jgi:uncharacterized protein (TIGR03084 family)
MNDDLNAIIDDLDAEQAALRAVLGALPALDWDKPTHAVGWSVRDQVSHLAYFDEAATRAMQTPEAFMAEVQEILAGGGEGLEAGYLTRGREMSPDDLLDWWRTASQALIAAARRVDASARVPWYGPAMSAASFITARLMETWAHGLDIVDVVDGDRPDTDRLRHVAFIGVRARPYSYSVRGKTPPGTEVRVELTLPSGRDLEFGEAGTANVVRGTATDFCRVVTQRRHPADTNLEISGPAAEEWMAIAQAFAGPPGEGRRPGEFERESQA